LLASPAHPTFLKQDGRHRFLICIVATMVQQCNLRTRGGHLSSKMRDELGLLVSMEVRFHQFIL
jgi:hypothetical protein